MSLLRCNRCIALANVPKNGWRRGNFSTFSPVTSSSSSSRGAGQAQDDDYRIIYRFPYIVAAKAICKLKLYQTGVVVGLTGASFFIETDVTYPIGLCSASLVMLAVMGEFFRKLVGLVYVDGSLGRVRIAHLNFWGNRKNIDVETSSIIPFSDAGERTDDAFVKIKFYNKSTTPLYLSFRYGHVTDAESFQHVFGKDM